MHPLSVSYFFTNFFFFSPKVLRQENIFYERVEVKEKPSFHPPHGAATAIASRRPRCTAKHLRHLSISPSPHLISPCKAVPVPRRLHRGQESKTAFLFPVSTMLGFLIRILGVIPAVHCSCFCQVRGTIWVVHERKHP